MVLQVWGYKIYHNYRQYFKEPKPNLIEIFLNIGPEFSEITLYKLTHTNLLHKRYLFVILLSSKD